MSHSSEYMIRFSLLPYTTLPSLQLQAIPLAQETRQCSFFGKKHQGRCCRLEITASLVSKRPARAAPQDPLGRERPPSPRPTRAYPSLRTSHPATLQLRYRRCARTCRARRPCADRWSAPGGQGRYKQCNPCTSLSPVSCPCTRSLQRRRPR